jgi:hypothetical protein
MVLWNTPRDIVLLYTGHEISMAYLTGRTYAPQNACMKMITVNTVSIFTKNVHAQQKWEHDPIHPDFPLHTSLQKSKKIFLQNILSALTKS